MLLLYDTNCQLDKAKSSWPMYHRTIAMMNLGRNTMRAIQNFRSPLLNMAGKPLATAGFARYMTRSRIRSQGHVRDNKLALVLMIDNAPELHPGYHRVLYASGTSTRHEQIYCYADHR